MIKAYAGQRVHNAMIDALVQDEVARIMARRAEEEAARNAERDREFRRMQTELDLRRQKDPRIYGALIRDARLRYGTPGKCGPISRVWWAVVGWTVLAFGTLFDRLGV